jgi:hypothetical protein
LGDFKRNGNFYAVFNKPIEAVIDLHDFQKMTNLLPLLRPEENNIERLLVVPVPYKVAQVFRQRAGQEVTGCVYLYLG